MGAALIDSTFDLLRMNTQDMHGDTKTGTADRMGSAPDSDSYADMADAMSPPWMGDTSRPARPQDTDGKGSAFTNDLGQMLLTRATPTEPMRLTIHTLALSLCLYVPALGAAMFAYTMLRDVFPMAAQAV